MTEKKSSPPKRPPPFHPKAHKLSRHLSFIESDDDEDDDKVDVDSHRKQVQHVYDLEESQSLQISPVRQPPQIHASMSVANALTQMVTTDREAQDCSSKPTTKLPSVPKGIKEEPMTLDRRTFSDVAIKPITKVTDTRTKNTTGNSQSYKSATLPAKGRKATTSIRKGGERQALKSLLNGSYYWDRIRIFLDRAHESVDKPLHDTLPRQEAPWTRETSAVEQLRKFLDTQL